MLEAVVTVIVQVCNCRRTEILDGCLTTALLYFLGLTPLHCAVVAHNAVVHELQRNQQPHSPEVQELLLKNKSLVDTIKCLIQMGAAVEAKVNLIRVWRWNREEKWLEQKTLFLKYKLKLFPVFQLMG